MPAIGDQVATLEHDHATALAKIDSLVAANAALTSANAALSSENAALNKYADEIKAMVESVAGSALKMLQAARAPIVPASGRGLDADTALSVADIRLVVDTALDADNWVQNAASEELDEQDAGNANALASDSGDEQPEPLAQGFDSGIMQRVEDLPDAVERMLHRSSASSAPPVTTLRMPVDMTMIVEHDAGGLPMFLRRGTTFDALARARFET